jgi:hypothetical protein
MPNSSELAEGAVELAQLIRPHLTGKPPAVVGAALAELCAIFIAGHAPPLREDMLKLLRDMTAELIPVIVEQMIAEGRAPPEWRDEESWS